MDCKVFRKRLTDLIEDNISYDLKEAMLSHIAECEACRALYENELSIDETITKGLSIDPTSFRSLRGEIMKNIDKDRYGKSPLKKFLFHLKKYRGTYTSLAAVVTAAILITPYIAKNGIGFGTKKSESMPRIAASQDSTMKAGGNANLKSIAPQAKSAELYKAEQDNNVAMKATDIYMPRFEKKQLDKNYKASFSTAWKDSSSKKYSATVEGKGETAIEEGIGKVILKDLNTGAQWSFELLDNEKQFTPKNIAWVDDENLLVIVGYGYGAVNYGGELYFLNINTSEVTKADPENKAKTDNKSEITKILSVKVLSNNEIELNLEMLIYEDDSLNKNHTENRTIVIPNK